MRSVPDTNNGREGLSPWIARLVGLTIAAVVLPLAWRMPAFLGMDEETGLDWLAALQLAGPTAAAALAGIAAWRSQGSDRRAWALIAAASVVYVLSNIALVILAKGSGLTFPTLSDAGFFVMAVLFGMGISYYNRGLSSSRTIDVYNFALLYGAVVIGTLLLLHHAIKASELSEFATLVAFLYPAFWCSVAAYAAIVLVMYAHGRRRFPLTLLIVAVSFEALADFIYAAQLMAGSYEVGGWPHVLWMLSALLIAWAAAEHALIAPELEPAVERFPENDAHVWAQATAPALILLVILLGGSIAGAFGRGLYQAFAAALSLALAVIVGLREYKIVVTRNNLQAIAEERARRLTESEQRITSVLESTSDAVLALDSNWRVRYFNRHALNFVPELRQHGIGALFWDLFRPHERETHGATFERVLKTGQSFEGELYSEQRDLWFDMRVYSTGDGVSLFFRDISEERKAREEIAYRATHDDLTGLNSRGVFNGRLAELSRSGTEIAVLLIDLDEFKEINDTLGHAVGDAILVQVAERLRECVADDCLLVRLGGDEFAVVAPAQSMDTVTALGERIIRALAEPFLEARQILAVGASIGIASTRTGTGNELFTQADIALYEAKSSRRGGIMVFEPAMEAKVRGRKELLADLSAAIENSEFELDYQPIVDTATSRTVAFEALIRWRHPVRGLVSPTQFIPLAEESGLICEIGEWALRTACREALRWPESIAVSVNISTRQLADETLLERIVSVLSEVGLDHRRLELEVTETALLRTANLPVLKALQDLGIRIALDDFGTGYSSLSYLQRFQFSKLKIDQSFIANVPYHAKSKAIVRTVVELARTLGMSVTAEGVETSEQFNWVSKHCEQAQGYFISKPMPASAIASFLEIEKRPSAWEARRRV